MSPLRRTLRRIAPSIGLTALLTEAVTALRRGKRTRALLLVAAALLSLKARAIAYPVYGYVIFRRLQERRTRQRA